MVKSDLYIVMHFLTCEWHPFNAALIVGVDNIMYRASQLGKRLVFEWVPREKNVYVDQMCHEARRVGRNVVYWKIAHCEMVAAVEDDLKPVPVYEVPNITGEEVQMPSKY